MIYKTGQIVRSTSVYNRPDEDKSIRHYLILGKSHIADYEDNEYSYRVWWMEMGKEISIILEPNQRFQDEVIYE